MTHTRSTRPARNAASAAALLLFTTCTLASLPAASQHHESEGRAETGVMLRHVQQMPALVLDLLDALPKISDYPVPRVYPQVHRVGRPALERAACAGHDCWAVKAAYVRDKGMLYLDGALDLQDVLDRSILLHELVHHMQNVTQRYAHLSPCQRYRIEEREAFEVQNAYLAQFRPRQYIPFAERMYQCDASG